MHERIGLACLDCEVSVDGEAGHTRCDRCGGPLEVTYPYEQLEVTSDRFGDGGRDGAPRSMWRYDTLLPFDGADAVSLGEGETPLVECAKLARELDVERVVLKDEGRNPTGSVADRGVSVGVTAARATDASTVSLPSTGADGQSVAAYAARAGLESVVYVPARAGFTAKAMINVHGGEMTVVGGRFEDARAAYDDAASEENWHPLRATESPYRVEGAKTVYYELLEDLEWTVPDRIVVPTGDGVTLVGMAKAARELRQLGLVEEVPAFTAAQAAGCAPIVEAFESGNDEPAPIEYPDTICGEIEVPAPALGARVLEALRESDGTAVAADDGDTLEAAAAVARSEGVEMAPSGATAASGTWELANDGALERNETVVLINTGAGNTAADVLRSHLMGQGV